MAAAHTAARLRRARGGRRSRRRGGVAERAGRVGRAPRRDRGGRPSRGRLLRGVHGLSGAILHGDERPRGDARDRAADDPPGPPVLPADLPGDAPAHRRAPSGDRRRDELRRPHGRRPRAARSRARGRAPPRRVPVARLHPPLDGVLAEKDNWSSNQKKKAMSPKRGVAPLRRAEIVRATIRCLARDGYSGLTMKRVAREAKVSQGILHYYFADKRAILTAALETVTADLDRRVAAAQARVARDARARLLALVGACLRLAAADRTFWIVFVEFWGEMMHDRRLGEINAALYARMRRLIGAVIAQGIRAGDFRRVDVLRAAAVILALVDGVSLQVAFDPAAFGVADATRFCGDAVMRYLAREAP